MAKPKLTEADVWEDRYESAKNRQERMFDTFARYYDLMYAHLNTKQYALWRSKVFLPIIPTKAWGMVSRLQSMSPGWEISLYGDALQEEDAQMKAEKAQWKLEHDWDNPLFDEPMDDKLFSPLVDAVVTGTGIAKVPWCYQNRTRYEKYTDENGEIDLTQDEKIEEGIGFNDFIPQDIMATFIAPGAKNIYSAEWVILEDEVTYSQLVEENNASGGDKYDKSALAQVKDMKGETDQFLRQKQSRNQITNQDQDPQDADGTIDKFKRLECYEKSTGYIYTFAVGTGEKAGEEDSTFVQLSAKPNEYWHGKYPLVVFYIKKRPHSVWGQGVFEDTERMMSAFNDLFNHYMDNLHLSLDGMIMKQEGEDFEYFVEPGGEFIYKNEKPEQFKFPEPDANSFQQVMSMIEGQIENATISDYALGTPNSATDNTQGTATGIARLQEAAGDKLASMKKQFANSLREVGRMWLSNNQQFLDRPITLEGEVDSQPAPVEISPKDLQGDMILRVNDASMEPMTDEQTLAQYTAYTQQLLGLQQASIAQWQVSQGQTKPLLLDFTDLAKQLGQKMGQVNNSKVLLNNDEVQMPDPVDPNAPDPNAPDPNAPPQVDPLAAQAQDQSAQQADRQHELAVTQAKDQAVQQQADSLMKAQQQEHSQTMDHANIILKAHELRSKAMAAGKSKE
jgi:hypothetical protein